MNIMALEISPPQNHDAGDPDLGPNLLQDEIAGHLENEVANEKDARSGAIRRIVDAEIVLHLELGESDVNAIYVRQGVTEEEIRYHPPRHFAIGGSFEFWCCYTPVEHRDSGSVSRAVRGVKGTRQTILASKGLGLVFSRGSRYF
jgi:hypothetical protein